MNRTSGHPRVRSPKLPSATLRRELAEQYSELPEQSVAIALDQATRAAAVLLNNADGNAKLVAMLARDRLNAQRERRTAAARRIELRHRSRYDQAAR
jgi:hypothetical protein